VISPAARAASTWSIAAAFVASCSFSEEMPRCLATASRNAVGDLESVCAVAIAAPAPPATAAPANTATSTLLDLSFFIAASFVWLAQIKPAQPKGKLREF
jgi:ACR3 family arsenite efflux pump ArsB